MSIKQLSPDNLKEVSNIESFQEIDSIPDNFIQNYELESKIKLYAPNDYWEASEDTKKKLSQSLLALDKRAWEIKTVYDNPSALQMWYSADFYYNFWLMFDKPGIRRFVSAYNLFYNDCINEGSFNKMLLRFKSGWIPEVDEKWLLLRDEYEKTERGDRP